MDVQRPTMDRVCKRLFLLTGFTNEEKKMLVEIIITLGGKFQDTVEFVHDCTHVISAKPIRSEKFLCGCASGKWVLTPCYLRKSVSAGKWLQEEQFEWSAVAHNSFPPEMISAPRRWRLHVLKGSKAAFTDWTVFLMVKNDHKRPAVYKRLIEAGGGKTVTLPKSSSRDRESFVDCVTHVIADHCYSREVQMFARAGVPCLHPEYLAEYIFQVNPKMKPYLIKDHPTMKEEVLVDKIKRSRLPRVYIDRRASESCCLKIPSQPCVSEVNHEHQEPSSSSSSSSSSASSSRGSKRKLQLRQDIEGALEARKRRKMVHHQPSVPPWVRSSYKTFKSKDNNLAQPFTQAQQNIIDACIEEKQRLDALVTIESYLSTKHYPPPELLHRIMQWVLNGKDHHLAVACVKVLQATLCMHSPALNPQMTQVYLDALLDGPREIGTLYKYMATTDLWDFLQHVIKLAGRKRCHSPTEGPSTSQEDGNEGPVDANRNDAGLLLEFLTFQIEDDFTAWKNRKEYKLPVSDIGCMITRIIWPSSKTRYPSRLLTAPFKQLLKNIVRNLVKTQVPAEVGDKQFSILKQVLSLLNMAAEYCTYETHQYSTELNLAGNLVTEFSMAVVSQIIDSGVNEDPEKLSLLLSLLRPQWLKLKVIQGILDRRHQSILEKKEAEKLRATPLTLKKIVDYYFWMVPEIKAPPPPVPSPSPSIDQSSSSFRKSSVKPLGDSNIDKRRKQCEDKNKRDENKMAATINKKNTRGETQLHVACIKNKLDKLKQLLSVPGININAPDHAGWTPLHEAANHGHALCVMELLKFKPKTNGIKTDIASKPINLVAAPSECGTTALHDAVFNNHVECARLIAEAGGEAVLSARNMLGFTPVDLAKSEDMKAALRVTSEILPDHNKENRSGLRVDTHKALWSPDPKQDVPSTRLPEHQYINLLGPKVSRWQVISEQSCECYCILASQLLSSYSSLRELCLIKRDMGKRCDLPVPVVIKKESLRSRNGLDKDCVPQTSAEVDVASSEKLSTGRSKRTCPKQEEAVLDDMEVFVSLGKNLKQFVEHMERVGSWENGMKDNTRCRTALKTAKLLSL